MCSTNNITSSNWSLVLTLLFCLGLVSCSSENIKYQISNKELKISATLHGRVIPKDSLILESIKIVDVNADYSYKPRIRLWGIGQPRIQTEKIKLDKYLEGWFLLNNGDIALLFLSEHKKAIFIKTKLSPPAQVKFVYNYGTEESPADNKTFSLLLGTDTPIKLKEKMEQEWGLITSDMNK